MRLLGGANKHLLLYKVISSLTSRLSLSENASIDPLIPESAVQWHTGSTQFDSNFKHKEDWLTSEISDLFERKREKS